MHKLNKTKYKKTFGALCNLNILGSIVSSTCYMNHIQNKKTHVQDTVVA